MEELAVLPPIDGVAVVDLLATLLPLLLAVAAVGFAFIFEDPINDDDDDGLEPPPPPICLVVLEDVAADAAADEETKSVEVIVAALAVVGADEDTAGTVRVG